MSRGAISKVTLRKFRGASQITELEFRPDERVVLIFGENGTGKSSIIDALDVVSNGNLGSLEGRSSAKKREYLPTIGCSVNDLEIALHAGSDQWTARLGKSRTEVTGPEPIPRIHVLRRSQLLRLIEAEPGKRYEELQRFIDVADVERAEQALRDATGDAKDDLTRLSREITDALNVLQQQWDAEQRPGTDARSWATAKSAVDTALLDAKIGALDEILGAISRGREAKNRLAEAEAEIGAVGARMERVERRIAEAPSIGADSTVEVVTILQDAAEYLERASETTRCPVCQQGVDADELRQAIAQRLERMGIFRELEAERKKAKADAASSQRDSEKARHRLVEAAQHLLDTAKRRVEFLQQIRASELASFEGLTDPAQTPGMLVETAGRLVARFTAAENAIVTEQDALKRDQGQLGLLQKCVRGLEEKEREAEELEALQERLLKALGIVESRRKSFTSSILDSVVQECNRLYRTIHIDESLGDLKITLDPKKRNSVLQEAKFEGKTVPPQAYFSDSHLDTLGFCVWLALAKRESPEDTIVALDDVFTSVDAPHLTRIVSLLSEESVHFKQIIVATHYRLWLDLYRSGQGQGRKAQLFELHPWTLSRGIGCTRAKLRVEELEDRLKAMPLDRQGASSLAGVVLESLLDHLTLQYRCSVPRNRTGVYTLGDLLDGCSKLFKFLKTEEQAAGGNGDGSPTQISLLPLVERIRSLQFVRNQVGCHFNADGLGIADKDVRDFSEATLALARALTCPSCGDIPSRDKGTHWACGCGRKHMTPLSSPA